MVSMGESVVFVDERSLPHDALVTAVWSANETDVKDARKPYPHVVYTETNPAINLVFVTSDENRCDDCGRQIERRTSVTHRSNQSAPGMFWKRHDE